MPAPTEEPPRTAAVLVPFCRRDDGRLRLVLIRRGERGLHGGQLAFPGGKPDPDDPSLLATALRETEEELGLSAEDIEIIEALPVLVTRTTGYRIFPFLARVAPPASWHPGEGEVAEVIEVTVRALLDPAARGEDLMTFPTWLQPKRRRYLRVGSYRLWGATYRILMPLLRRLSNGLLNL